MPQFSLHQPIDQNPYWYLPCDDDLDPVLFRIGGEMKFVYTIALATLLTVPACNSNNPERVRASSDATSTEERMKQDRDDYVKSANAKLAEFDQKFDGLDKRAGAMTGAAKNDFKSSIDGLRDQRKAVGEKLDDLKSVNVDSWMTLKSEVDSAIAGLEKSYEQVSASFERVPAAAPPTKRP